MLSKRHILEIVGATLGEERLAGAIVYLDRKRKRKGEKVQAGDVQFEAPWDAQVVFVDLEPKMNWGHACCYLAINPETDETIQVAGRMPPFLKAGANTFRFLWRGPQAPEWAVATGDD